MKEEVGMKRRGPRTLAVGVAVAGLVTALAAPALAAPSVFPGAVNEGIADIYTNDYGVQGAVGTTGEGLIPPDRLAGPDVNPGGIGQLLFGGFYDVRAIAGPTGTVEAQQTNIQLLNVAPATATNEGILARIRFRESKTSQEVLDFNIVLSCAQVWVASVTRIDDPTDPSIDGFPQIKSPDPVVTNDPGVDAAAPITYAPVLATAGQPFVKPAAGLTVGDIQRGYFEVFAEERLPCSPTTGDERTGTYSRTVNNPAAVPPLFRAPPNTLAGSVFIVRPLAGVSYEYNATAITRFVDSQDPTGIAAPITTGQPDVTASCRLAQVPGASPQQCLDAVDFVLSKSRLAAQWDELKLIAGQTYVVVTQPTKHHHCALNATGDNFSGSPASGFIASPFSCAPTGEEIGCTIYDRLENFSSQRNIFSPATILKCVLPREVTIIGFVETSAVVDPRADFSITYGELPDGPDGTEDEHGWLNIDLYNGQHARGNGVPAANVPLNPDVAQLLGTGYGQYQGLPVISYVIQEYFNGNVGGVFGAAVPPYHTVGYGT